MDPMSETDNKMTEPLTQVRPELQKKRRRISANNVPLTANRN